MSTLRLISAVVVATLASCQSMSQGVIAIEAQAIVLDDAELDDVQNGSAFDEENLDVSGYGLQLAIMTPIVDFLGSYGEREYADESTPEFALGLRRRFLEFWRFSPFIEANLRYGSELNNGFDEEDYTGWNAGVGLMLDLTDHVFINARIMYEETPIELPSGDDADATGVIGTLGVGFMF